MSATLSNSILGGQYQTLVLSLPLAQPAASGAQALLFASVIGLAAGLIVGGNGAIQPLTIVATLSGATVGLSLPTIGPLATGAAIAFSAPLALQGSPAATAAQIALWQTNLAQALAARHNLLTGVLPQGVLYSAGEGSRSVHYNKANLGALDAYIASLEHKLGIRRRRAIAMRYGT